MKKNKKDDNVITCEFEKILGVPPKELENIEIFSKHNTFIIHKSAKKDKISFLITKALLDSIWETSLKIQKRPNLIIDIQTPEYVYTLTCDITKNKAS